MSMLLQDAPHIHENIMLQIDFRKQLLSLSLKVKENRKDKISTKKETLRRLVKSEGPYNMQKFDPPRPMPILPRLYV